MRREVKLKIVKVQQNAERNVADTLG